MSRRLAENPMAPPTAGGQSCVEEGAMTDIGNSQPAIQVLEAQPDKKDLDKKNDRVAEFEVRAKSPLRKLQHFLHANPTAVPAIVLFSRHRGFRFHRRLALPSPPSTCRSSSSR